LLASISSATATRVVTDILIASKILTAQNYEKIPILPKELPQNISFVSLFLVLLFFLFTFAPIILLT